MEFLYRPGEMSRVLDLYSLPVWAFSCRTWAGFYLPHSRLYVGKIFMLNGWSDLGWEKRRKKILEGIFFVGPFYSTFLLIYIPIVRQVPGIKELFFVQVSDLVMLLFYTKLNWREDKYLPFTCSAFLIEDLTCFGESLVCRRVADTVFFLFCICVCVCVC